MDLTKDKIQTCFQFFIGLELRRISKVSQRILLLVDLLQFTIRELTKNRGRLELRLVIVPETILLHDLEFEVGTLPEVEHINRTFVFKLRLCCLNNLVKDLLAILEQEHLALILRMQRVFDHIDVAVVRQFAFLITCCLLISFQTTVPEVTVDSTDRIILTDGGQGVLNVPLSRRTFESMTPDLSKRQVLPIRRGQETNHSITITRLVKLCLPKTIISVALSLWVRDLLDLSLQVVEVGRLLECCERHNWIPRIFVLLDCVGSYGANQSPSPVLPNEVIIVPYLGGVNRFFRRLIMVSAC